MPCLIEDRCGFSGDEVQVLSSQQQQDWPRRREQTVAFNRKGSSCDESAGNGTIRASPRMLSFTEGTFGANTKDILESQYKAPNLDFSGTCMISKWGKNQVQE